MNINKRTYADGRVTWRARYPDPTRGGRRQIERQFPTKREAERWLTTQRSAVQRGEHIDPKDRGRLFKHVADAWRDTWVDLEPKTTSGYQSILNRHVIPRWGEARLSGVTPEAIQGWVNGIAAEREPNTVRRIYSVLRAVLNVGVERRYLTANPCDPVRLPKRNTERKQLFLTAAEVNALAEAINPHFRVLVYTAAYSGLRAGELGGLRRSDVDLLHGKLIVERALKEIGGRLIVGPTKTGKHRRVSMPKFLCEMLAEHLAALDGGPDAPVFTTVGGGQHRHNNFRERHFRKAVQRRYCSACDADVTPADERCEACGAAEPELVYVLPPEKHRLRFHDLRHTAASFALSVAPNLQLVMEMLGHRDIQTTVNIYGHLLPSVEDALAHGLDALYADATALPENVRELALQR